uniref:Rho guanine nucleotide exchange factor 10 n=1 Tax=Panagrellus redivivus TaxID=6233 RepID=A0A7E4VFE8_PANRE
MRAIRKTMHALGPCSLVTLFGGVKELEMAGMTVKAPDFMLRAFDKFNIPPDIDLNNGQQIKSIEESEEIDPEDNCKVHITTYNVISADGLEETQFTTRRKVKVESTQITKRLQFCNGLESNREEKTEVLTGEVDRSGRIVFGNNQQISGIRPNMFSESLLKKQNNCFQSLLMEKKEQLQKSFPELFAKMRTEPQIFGATETIVNPDGSVVTRTHSSKAFSSRFSHQETYVNGVRQQSKSKFRALFEYKGPEGGFNVNLSNRTDDDLSEDEDDDDDLIWRRFVLPDANTIMTQPQKMVAYRNQKPRGSRSIDVDRQSHSDFSEIADNTSALVTDTGKVPKIKTQSLKKHEKAFHAVNEIVDSEARYIAKLALLEKFRADIEADKVLDKRQMSSLFANISSLYQFHNQHLLPQLLDRVREWQSTRRISDVFKKQAPFMKMYSEYTNNYKNAVQLFEDCLKKKKKFAEIVHEFEKMPECENLPLMSHMICPVQRVMRYQLLLKEYLKYLSDDDVDYADTEKALELVLEAASHANEMMRRLDRYRNVLEVQELLGNSISLVSPGRELLKRAKLMKISSHNDKIEERLLFIFNDIILLAGERSISLGGGKFRVRAIFDALYTHICEGDNLERENSFYLRGCDSQSGPATRVELFTDTAAAKKELIDCIWAAISEVHQRKKSFTSSVSSNSITSPRSERKCCVRCDTDFSFFAKDVSCSKCAQKYCKKCFGPRRQEPKRLRICEDCIRQYNENGSSNKENRSAVARQDLLSVPASDIDEAIKFGIMKFRGPSGKTLSRYFVLRKTFCLYSYLDEQDDSALAMLPISGCEIEPLPDLSFSLRHLNRMYIFTTSNEGDFAEWMAALILSANAQLPSEDQRKST